MVQLNWIYQAIIDLQDIFEYISKDSKIYAKRQVLKIRATAKFLMRQPYIGKIVEEISNSETREIAEGNYRIIYQIISEKRIDILTIHHGSRDFAKRGIRSLGK